MRKMEVLRFKEIKYHRVKFKKKRNLKIIANGTSMLVNGIYNLRVLLRHWNIITRKLQLSVISKRPQKLKERQLK